MCRFAYLCSRTQKEPLFETHFPPCTMKIQYLCITTKPLSIE